MLGKAPAEIDPIASILPLFGTGGFGMHRRYSLPTGATT